MFNLKTYLFGLLVVLPNVAFSADREVTVCGWFKERLVFTMWSSMAPEPDASRVAGNDLIQRTEFTTADGKVLRGYKYQSQDENGMATEPEGYILVALGNAMIADPDRSPRKYINIKHQDVPSSIFAFSGKRLPIQFVLALVLCL